ncbi:hypothetical protein PSAC2689_120121 [Paraburkholderia sacchari]
MPWMTSAGAQFFYKTGRLTHYFCKGIHQIDRLNFS